MTMETARTDKTRSSPSITDAPADFAPPLAIPSDLRQRITAATRRPETECLPALIAAAQLSPDARARSAATARRLVEAIRAKPRSAGIEALVQEYSLSSQEGVALMCLAEALLRIPDTATRDALIRDKIAAGDWRAHSGEGRSLFVNAAAWGLVLTGHLTVTSAGSSLAPVLTRLIARCGEPLIRKAVDMAMRMMGEHFVTGETIQQALAKSRRMEAKGFRYSYDMLGEAAKTAAGAARYFQDYEQAIDAIGKVAAGRSLYDGPGISIKLSALHPRYSRSQAGRVMEELLPRVKALALQAKRFGIGLNIDAEEADRLELSLDILEALSLDPELAGWDGLGFVVQAYGKRCPFVIDFLIDLARRSGHRLMVRLVKGAYWDSEIKRAQTEGLEGFPVYTRKIYTDVSYLACARKLLEARAFVFPQFATHNALSLASIHAMAGEAFAVGDYEFQCLHGMGEPLYEEVVGREKLGRPCRIYAPVGTHETLLAYLVRRLLENGANSSFVNQIADAAVPVSALLACPLEAALQITPVGAPHPAIAHPRDLFAPGRRNSEGIDLANEDRLAALAAVLREDAGIVWNATPVLADETGPAASGRPVVNPADTSDIAGWVREASTDQAQAGAAAAARSLWPQTPAPERAACLLRAADLLQNRMPRLIGLLMREAGKTASNAIAEVREAVDFLRYYAAGAVHVAGAGSLPLGPIVCISPWNFPLAIFTGQVAAALAAGNPVLAKPAEETPLIAAQATAILHEAGIPRDALQLLTGDGRIGAALVEAPETRGVLFTGSTDVARLIQRQLAEKPATETGAVPLVAETGGLNVMIVDSSALAEQVVGDVLASAFDSAGQRCSALRVLCLQDEIADRTMAMLEGAMRELRIGRPDRLTTDIGPVISAGAAAAIEAHIAMMASGGHKVTRLALPRGAASGHFVAPALIEIGSIRDLEKEVFGPVLHVLRFKRADLDGLIAAINATGYGLTFGLHTRLDDAAARVRSQIAAGNIYINRNIVGAVVGSQPFGGSGLSGTGPKAGGPLYLRRLLKNPPPLDLALPGRPPAAPLAAFLAWLIEIGCRDEAAACRAYGDQSLPGFETELGGPSGERNIYSLRPRGCILLLPQTRAGLFHQMAAAFASGNRAIVVAPAGLAALLRNVPAALSSLVVAKPDWPETGDIDAVLAEGTPEECSSAARRVAAWPGRVVSIHGVATEALTRGIAIYPALWLLEEISVSIDTTAAGGNASLMTMG